MKIAPVVAILPERTIPEDTFWAFAKIIGQGWPLFAQPTMPTDRARNSYAQALLKSDFTHVVMLDIDHQHPPDIVQRLGKWVAQDESREVVTALAFRRCKPHDPCAFIQQEGKYYAIAEYAPGLHRVDATGLAAAMISRKVFERMPYPWFAFEYQDGEWVGEDFYFCQKCARYGISIWVDTLTVTPHMRVEWTDERTHREYLAEHPELVRPFA